MSTPPAPGLLSTLLVLSLSSRSPQEDWPRISGPNFDRTSPTRLASLDWASTAPATRWKIDLESGFSSLVVAGEQAFTLVTRAGRETCVALERASGREQWDTPLGEASYDGGGGAGTDDNKGGDGPRSTPVVVGGRVIVLDAHLNLVCLAADSGDVQWHQDLVADHGGRLIRWQNAACPLVVGDRVFVVGGGDDRAFLCFSTDTGALLWSSGSEGMTHATPTFATLHGVPQVLFYVQSGLVAVEPATGKELWRASYPYRTSSAASPVVFGNLVYVSAGYGVGAGVFEVSREGETFHAENRWQKRNKLINHWSTPVCRDGYLYGMFSFKDYGDGPLKCIELATGEERWSRDGFGPGNCILVGEHLVALSDAGDVVVLEARPDSYQELTRADLLDGKCWSTPTFADGQLFVRSTSQALRLDLELAAGD